MVGYNDPSAPYESNPSGIDIVLKRIQVKLGTISWLEKAFGRATKQFELINEVQKAGANTNPTNVRKGAREIIYPEGYGAKGEPTNLMPNDNVKAYSFFVVRDPTKFEDIGVNQTIANATVSIIVWFKMPTSDQRYCEARKTDVCRVLSDVIGLQLLASYEEHNKVFDPFTITEQYRGFMKRPYAGFRIDFEFPYPVLPENSCV